MDELLSSDCMRHMCRCCWLKVVVVIAGLKMPGGGCVPVIPYLISRSRGEALNPKHTHTLTHSSANRHAHMHPYMHTHPIYPLLYWFFPIPRRLRARSCFIKMIKLGITMLSFTNFLCIFLFVVFFFFLQSLSLWLVQVYKGLLLTVTPYKGTLQIEESVRESRR